jgi:hypothetical protein
MAYEALTQRRAGTGDLGDLARSSLQKRMTTGGPDLWAKFKEMDDATGRAANTVRGQGYMQANAQAGLGQGLASRNANLGNREIMQQVANNKLKQAQMLGDDKNTATSQAASMSGADDNRRLSALNMWLQNASEIGDSTSAGAAQDLLLGEGGYDYTGAARGRMATDARVASGDEASMRQGIDDNMQKSQANADKAAKEAKRRRLLEFAQGLTSGNPISAAGAFLS